MSSIALCVLAKDEEVNFDNSAYCQAIPLETPALNSLRQSGSAFPGWFLNEDGSYVGAGYMDEDGNYIEPDDPECMNPADALAEMKRTRELVLGLDLALFDDEAAQRIFLVEFDELLSVVEEASQKGAEIWFSAADV